MDGDVNEDDDVTGQQLHDQPEGDFSPTEGSLSLSHKQECFRSI